MDVLLEPETVRWLAPTAAAFTAILVSITTFAMSRARDRQIQRAKLIRALTADFYSQEDLRELFADIDALAIGIAPNSKRWGSEFRVEGSRREAAVIHLLDYLNTVGHAQQRGALPVGDLAGTTIGYMVFRTWAARR